MIFKKSFDTPNPIPDTAISNAVSQMKHGMLYRYGHTSDDSEVSKLEYAFGQYTGHKYVIAVNSCGSAMFIALKSMGIQADEGVFTNAFTFTAVPSSIVHANATPVYIECNDQYIIDISHLKQQIIRHPDVKYFILSHMRGHVAQLDEIKALCEKNNIRLIEDCAHGLGKRWNNNETKTHSFVGHHCEIACYSTQSHKLINAGEGGFIATNDEDLAAYCILAAGSYEGLYKKHLARPLDDRLFERLKHQVPNFSLRMNNLTAAILRPQIDLIDERISSYKEKYHRIIEQLSALEHIYIPSPIDNTENLGDSLQFNLIDFNEVELTQFISINKERGVIIQVFGRNNNARDFRNWEYSFKQIPNCSKTIDVIDYACDLRLPLDFTIEDIDIISTIITQALNEVKKDTIIAKLSASI